MSLDGYIAGPAETGFDQLFKWYGNGDIVMQTTHPDLTLRLTPQSAEVRVNGGTISRQCLNVGLLDEISVELVPVLLGGGTPFSVVQGNDVTHLRCRVRNPRRGASVR
jgi:dihydrofolate reductase